MAEANESHEGHEGYKKPEPPKPIHKRPPVILKKTQSALKDYQEALLDRIKNSDAAATVKHKDFDSSQAGKDNAKACYEHAKDGFTRYKTINLETVCMTSQDAKEAFGQIDYLNGKLKKEIDEGFKNSIKAVKDLRGKVKKINEAFCKFENELGDNCNSKQVDLIRKELRSEDSDQCSRVPDIDSNDYFDEWTKLICDDVKDVITKSSEFTNRTVQISSVNALVNLNNLKSISEDLKNKMEDLKKNVTETSKFMEDKLKEECTKYEEATAQHQTNLFAEKSCNLKLQGELKTCEFKDTPLTPLLSWDDTMVKEKIIDLLNLEN